MRGKIRDVGYTKHFEGDDVHRKDHINLIYVVKY